jgi:hypothetical protein
MSNKSFARFRAISISIFVIGAVSAGFAYSLQKKKSPQLQQRKGFTLRMKGTTIPFVPRQLDPRESTHTTTTRYQKSDGTFKQERIYYNANGTVVKKDILFGVPGQGVFKLNNPQGPLEFLSSMSPKDQASYVRVDDGRSQPNFLREDVVQGYKTYVLRFPDEDGGYFETYSAPELDGQPLRKVAVSRGGVTIQEVAEITLGDPDDGVFGPLPNMLVSYDLFRVKITAMEEAGKHDAAEALQRQLDEQISKQMQDSKLMQQQ